MFQNSDGLKVHCEQQEFAVTAGQPAPFAKGFQVTAFCFACESNVKMQQRA
jgi:hypothetical protein